VERRYGGIENGSVCGGELEEPFRMHKIVIGEIKRGLVSQAGSRRIETMLEMSVKETRFNRIGEDSFGCITPSLFPSIPFAISP
jgi:hypothetical protein